MAFGRGASTRGRWIGSAEGNIGSVYADSSKAKDVIPALFGFQNSIPSGCG